jgi:Holliday junction DNA helicase RuvB
MKTEIGDVRPTSLAHLVGQRGVLDQVAVALDAAHADGKKFDHALLVGPPGLGKSALAEVAAREMASGFHEVLGQSIATPADLNALLLGAQDRDVVHIDECHELPKEYQTVLYLALDQRRLALGGGRTGKSVQSVPLADFTLLLSTTDEYGLMQPLRDRMKLLLRFDYYSPDDLALLVRQRAAALGWEVHGAILPLISGRSRGRPGSPCGCSRRPGGSAGPRATPRSPPPTSPGPAASKGSTGGASARPSGSTSASSPAGRPG